LFEDSKFWDATLSRQISIFTDVKNMVYSSYSGPSSLLLDFLNPKIEGLAF